ADETRNPEKRHEPKRRPHDKERKKSAHGSVGHRSENQKRLDRMVELQNKSNKNRGYGNCHNHRQVAKTIDLFGLFSTNEHRVSGRQRCLKGGELRHGGVEHLRRESAINRSTFHTDGSEMLLAANLLELQPVLNRGNLEQRNALCVLRGIDIKILDIRELRP